MLFRPRGAPEWVSAGAGALLSVTTGLVPFREAGRAVLKGTDVYLFLIGMMLLAELARRENVFAWLASHAVRAARGSRFRLFMLVYGVGICVTVVLSNDATAVVLTPAVAVAARKAKVDPLPYVFACAFIANAASFVLPISNPANLVVFAGTVPTLPRWLAAFALPSLLAIATTFVVLGALSRRDFRGPMMSALEVPDLGRSGTIALGGIVLAAVALIVASTFGVPLGATTFASGALAVGIAGFRDRAAFAAVRSVTWSVLVLVAALFILVHALDETGLLAITRRFMGTLAEWPEPLGGLTAAGAAALVSNLTNNLPCGLIAGATMSSLHGHDGLRSSVAIGIDLGPNLSVSGSLATVLWLAALRREQIHVDAWAFLRLGALVMPPALLLAAASSAVAP